MVATGTRCNTNKLTLNNHILSFFVIVEIFNRSSYDEGKLDFELMFAWDIYFDFEIF